MKKLDKAEFADALRKGKGRAILHAQAYGAGEFLPQIVEACIHDPVYDWQVNSLALWLLELAEAAKVTGVIASVIIDEFADCTDDADASQIARMLEELARKGMAEARAALYAKFNRQDLDSPEWIATELVDLDGLDGLRHAVKVIGQRLRKDPDCFADRLLLIHAADEIGRQAVKEMLETAARTDADIAYYLAHLAKDHEDLFSYGKSPKCPKEVTLADYLEFIETGKKPYGHAIRFGQHGSKEDLAALAGMIEGEADPLRLTCLLAPFAHASLPYLPGNLVGLVASDGKDLRRTALRALSKLTHPDIRNLAVGALENGQTDGIKLIQGNFQPGDWARLEAVLPEDGDDDDLHRIGLDLIDIKHETAATEAARCMTWVYEQTPCPFCRGSAVDRLAESGALPVFVAEECLFDSVMDTRQAARDFLCNASSKPP